MGERKEAAFSFFRLLFQPASLGPRFANPGGAEGCYFKAARPSSPAPTRGQLHQEPGVNSCA